MNAEKTTCLFTGETLTAQTAEEHTIPAALGGRIRSRIVSSSFFNEKCGQKCDPALAKSYRMVFEVLAPVLSFEHNPGQSRRIGKDGRRYVVQNGVTSLPSLNVIEKDSTGKPRKMMSTDIALLSRCAKTLCNDPNRIELRLNRPLPTNEFYDETPTAVIVAEAELSALKCALLTFDHLLAEQPTRRFTRHPDLSCVREFVRSSVMDKSGIAVEGLHRHSLGIQIGHEGRYSKILASQHAMPEQEFEHVLIASGNTRQRILDLVWCVAGIEWRGFRVSYSWDAFDFTCIVRSQVLRNGRRFAPIWSDDSQLLCTPVNSRAAPGRDVHPDIFIPSYLRQDAYRRATFHILMNSNEKVREALVNQSMLTTTQGHLLAEAILSNLETLWSPTTVASSTFKSKQLELRKRVSKYTRTVIATESDAANVDWPECIALYRDIVQELCDEFGLVGYVFVKSTATSW